MLDYPDFSVLDHLSEQETDYDLSLIIQSLLNDIKIYLKLDMNEQNIKFEVKSESSDKPLEFFNIGVKRTNKDNLLLIEIYDEYENFLPFILLREIYRLFVPKEIVNSELIQLVINQIIMRNLSKNPYTIEWRRLIRENLKYSDQIPLGFNRLTAFERLESYFKLQKVNFDPTLFFFNYIRTNFTLLSSKFELMEEDIHNIFFDEFNVFISRSMNNDEIIETIRCLIYIFYNVKSYRDLLSYKNYFQEFKKSGELDTELSLRSFLRNIDWIKKYSFISPSYQLNWKSIDVAPYSIFLRFNPLLSKTKVFKVIENIPFLLSPKISRNGFCLEISGHIPLPRIYQKDLYGFIEKLKTHGYIIKTSCILNNNIENNLNLNYFKENFQKYILLNPKFTDYEPKYELKYKIGFGTDFIKQNLDILDFLIFDRIKWYSVTGLGFERISETLNKIKLDLLNEIITQRTQIKNLKEILGFFYRDQELKAQLLNFLELKASLGFFAIRDVLIENLSMVDLIQDIISNNPKCRNLSECFKLIRNKRHNLSIEKNVKINKIRNLNVVLKDFFSLYFKSKKKFDKKLDNFKKFSDLFNLFYNLKIFDIKAIKRIILDQNLVETIFTVKEQKLRNSYEKYKPYKITSQVIDEIINKFINHKPPIIQPSLIDTIITSKYINDFLILLLINTDETKRKLQIFKKSFIGCGVMESIDIFSKEKLLYVIISTPLLTKDEKKLLYTVIYNNFKGRILYGNSFLWSGFNPAFSLKSFYDFDNKEFFYSENLFSKNFTFIKQILGEKSTPIQFKHPVLENKNWSTEKDLLKLITDSNNRTLRENQDFNINHLNQLLDFHLNLNKILLDIDKFKKFQNKTFFDNFIKSIKFIPAFQHFGLDQFSLYFNTFNIDEVDLKLLLTNTFRKIKYPPCIDTSNSFFIKYIMPHKTPNLTYLNWLVKAKKIIREYCVFFINKVYQICHFNYNLNQDGWKYDKDKFKMYMQNILFNPNYDILVPRLKELNISNLSISSIYGPNSLEYQSLIQIYNWNAIDIKSYLGTSKHSIIENTLYLLKKQLIFPYLTLKNLGLHSKLCIILPKIKLELNEIIIKIFSWFNYGFIYEIEGQYFIYGFSEEVKFENGMMIKLYLPKCELHEFERTFDILFEYLEIKDYIILNDLVEGTQLLKSIFAGVDFLKEYNPLKNLIWNSKDKKWMNHKIFTQKFEPIYPDLIPRNGE
ncbi:MAG: hypothetical protein ACW980_08920 [Promethearchaeota archaeon]|jgi:hypothetical protein